MNVFSALLDEVKGVFGKGYVLAGLLPAAILVAGWKWYRSGESLDVLFAAIAPLFESDSTSGVSGVAAVAALTLLLGLAFFAARSVLMSFAQRLPGHGLGWVREALLRRQVARQLRLLHRAELLLHSRTVLKWISNQEIEKPVYRPDHRSAVDGARVREASAAARDALGRAIGPADRPLSPPPPNLATTIQSGLELLYDHAFEHFENPDCQAEILAWSKQLENLRARTVLELLSARLHRRWALPRQDLEGLPSYKRMLPTLLGSRAAALDEYAEKRYGLDTSTLLVRLWSVLDESEQKSLADTRLSTEVFINLSAAMAFLASAVTAHALFDRWRSLVALIGGFYAGAREFLAALIEDGSVADLLGLVLRKLESVTDPRPLLFSLIPLVLAALLYRAAVFAYGGLAEKVIRAVDVSRLDLLEKLGFARPATVGEEVELWSELRKFFLDAKHLDADRILKVEN